MKKGIGSCSLCNSPFVESDLLIKRRFEEYSKSFDLYRCRECGFVQTLPVPDLMLVEQEYSDDYMAYREKGNIKSEISASRTLKLIKKLSNNEAPRILDVGCSTGWFLKVAEKKGFRCDGFEINENAANIANGYISGRVYGGRFKKGVFPENAFDVVYSNQVIEHLTDPIEFIETAVYYLKKGGILVIGTPNIASLSFRVLKGGWASLQKPDHVVFFNPHTMRNILKTMGFVVERVVIKGMIPVGSSKEIVTTNINKIDKGKRRRRTILGELKNQIFSSKSLTFVAAGIINALKLGDTFVVVAKYVGNGKNRIKK